MKINFASIFFAGVDGNKMLEPGHFLDPLINGVAAVKRILELDRDGVAVAVYAVRFHAALCCASFL